MQPVIPSWNELRLVMPEIVLAITMCAIILVPFAKRTAAAFAGTAIAGLILALAAVIGSLAPLAAGPELLFHGSLAIDPFSQFFKLMLVVFTGLIVGQWWLTNRDGVAVGDVPDFLCLLVGAAVGMSLMSSANSLLTIFVATEAASLPSFALAGFRKKHRIGSESSLKYVIFGAASSAVMVYGMSLVYGATGTMLLPGIAAAAGEGVSPLLAVGFMAVLAGFAFKLSAVPLHFWCPDVFQGAPTEVTTFLSVASKGAAVAMLLRVLATFGAVTDGQAFTGLAVAVGIVGGLTALWGNLAALAQNNIKRLLAYSSISHAGYMIMGASVIVFAGRPGYQLDAGDVTGAILFYLLVYLFMNLGAFTVAAIMARQTGSEDIRDYAGLINRNPVITILLMVFLLSLFGMPGLGGFMAKLTLAAAMAKAGTGGLVLVGVLLINTLISLYYYLRPVYYMILVPGRDQARPVAPIAATVGMGLCAAVLLFTGIFPGVATGLTGDFARVAAVAPAKPETPALTHGHEPAADEASEIQ